MNASTEARPHRVVIIGSGFGGLFGAQRLRKANVEVTLIARTTHHLFQTDAVPGRHRHRQ